MTLPIGIFDSGVGGLTVLDALHRQMPNESLLYFGDTARLPYGTKSRDTVCRYATQAAQILVEQGVKALVVADNTSSAHALETLRETFPTLPIIGVVQPGVAAAVEASRNGTVGILATEGVVHGGLYVHALRRTDPTLRTASASCSLLVSLVEEGQVSGPLVENMVRYVLSTLKGEWDTLLLGCTHLPPLRETIRHIVGPDAVVVDSATTTALAVQKQLHTMNLLVPETVSAPEIRCLVTDAPERFARLAPTFLETVVLSQQQIMLVHLERI